MHFSGFFYKFFAKGTTVMKKIIVAVLSVFAAYAVGLYFLQDMFLYEPDKFYIAPQKINMPEFKENLLATNDGEKIMTWYFKGHKNKPALLFFHGNCKQMAEFAPHLRTFIKKNYTVLMMEYRGFGANKGHINQKNMYADAQSSFDWLKKQGYQTIIAYGYSLGTAAASNLAATRPVDGVILTAPFYSMRKLVSQKPVLWAKYLLKDTYDNAAYLAKSKTPILIIHGKKDKLISYINSVWLNEVSASDNKKLYLLENVDHHFIFFAEHNQPYILEWLRNFEQ